MSKRTLRAIIGFVLIIVILAGAWLTGWQITGKLNPKDWFNGNSEEQTQTDGGLVTSVEGVENLNAVTRRIAPASFSAYSIPKTADSAVTIELSYNVTPPSFNVTWYTPHFVNPSSEWAQGKSASDYMQIAPTTAGALTATATCVAAFSEPITVEVHGAYNTSCVIRFDYVKGLKLKDDCYVDKGLPVIWVSNCVWDECFGDFSNFATQILNYGEGTITPDWSFADVTTYYDAAFDYPCSYVKSALLIGGEISESFYHDLMIYGDADEADGSYEWFSLDGFCDDELIGNINLVTLNDDRGDFYFSVRIEAKCYYGGVSYRIATFNALLAIQSGGNFFKGAPLKNYTLIPNTPNVIF
ncbi:MAG: hypothetical protein K2N47_05605 [Clostridia bacterium]|nr:hypothetical protein [Clostridia bacterium]